MSLAQYFSLEQAIEFIKDDDLVEITTKQHPPPQKELNDSIKKRREDD